MYIRHTCIILTIPEKNTNEFIYKKWFVAKIGMWRPSYFKQTRYPRIIPLCTKKASIAHTIYRMMYFSWNNCTWVDMFSKYVKFWKYRVDLLKKLWFWKWFIEIVQEGMVGRNLPKPYFFIKNTKRQKSYNSPIASV
jgi:hypothetical protein